MPIIATAISAIGSAFAAGGIFAAGGALSLVGRFLVTTAISLLGRATADKPRTPGIRNEQTLAGGVNPATFILGRYATGGAAICPEMTYGLINAWGQAPDTPNEYLVYVIDVGDIPGGSGLEQLSIDGVPITLGSVEEYLPALPIYEVGVDPETGYPTEVQIGTVPAVSKGLPGTGAYAGNLWVKFRTGNETTADPYLRRVFADYPERPWTEDMIGVGVPHVILTFRRNPSLFQGYPKCRFVVGGIPLYDWRRDSTVGGSGPQRWSDRATWQSSENPVVQTYNILRGIDFGGVDIWGGKAPADAFRLAEWTVEANKADQLVSLSGGGTEPQFRAGFEVTAFDEPSSIVEELMRGCGGQVADIGGTWRIRIGAPALPVWLFNDDDVIVSSPQDLSPFPGLDATFNAITATFPDPAMDWEPGEAPPRYNALWEALDQNRRLPADLNLPATPYPDQVQRVMRAYIEGERRFASHILTLPPEAGSLEPLDALSWASIGNGYDGKSFELTEIAHDLLGGNVQVSLREVDPADHTWSPSFELPFNRPSSAVVTRPAAHVGGAAVSAETLLDATSAARRPAIKLVWTPVEPGMFQGLEWEMRVAGQSDTRGGTDQAISAGAMIIVDGILPATAYQLRARWVANQDVAWTPWLAVTTVDVRIGTADLDSDVVAAITPDTTPPAVPTALSVTTSVVSDAVSLLVASWTAPVDLDLDGYEVRVKVGAGDFVVRLSADTRYEERLSPGETYSVQVRAFDTSGNRSTYTAMASGTAVKDTTPPAVPTGLVINAGYQMLWVKWNPNTESDLHHYEIYEQASSTPAPLLATPATFSSAGAQMARTSLPSNLTRHYWVRAVDTTGNKSAWSPRQQGTTAASAGVNSAALAGLVDAASFASSVKPVEIVATLPAAPHVQGRQVFLTTDNKLYRNTGGGWTKEVDGVDLKANTVTTGAIAAGAVNTGQLAAGAATIDKLAVRSSQTVNIDPYYEDASAWIAPNITRVAAPAGGVGPWWLQAAAPGTNVTFPSNRSPIDPTKTYLLEGWLARLTPTGDGKSFFTVNFFSANGTPVASGTGWSGLVGANHYFPSLGTIPTLTPARHTITIGPQGTAAIPSNAAFISFGFFWNYESTVATTGLVGPIRMTEMAAGEAIIDGTLQARHVTTDEFITKTAQIKDAIVTEAKIGALSAAKLTAGTALAGSITVSGRALATVAASDAYIENMGNASHWSNYVGVAPTFVASPDAKVGTDVLQSNAYCWAYGNQPVIFDPNKLYRIAAIIRRSGADAGGLLYLGLVGYAEDGITKVNTGGSNTPSNQHYCVATAVTQSTLPLNEWTEFVGYVKGVSAVAPGAVGTLEAPSKMHPNVKKLAPLLILNYTTGTTPMQVDYFRIEVVNEDAAAIVNAGVTNINGGKIETGSITADKMMAGTITAASGIIADLTITNNLIAGGAVSRVARMSRWSSASVSGLGRVNAVVVSGAADTYAPAPYIEKPGDALDLSNPTLATTTVTFSKDASANAGYLVFDLERQNPSTLAWELAGTFAFYFTAAAFGADTAKREIFSIRHGSSPLAGGNFRIRAWVNSASAVTVYFSTLIVTLE